MTNGELKLHSVNIPISGFDSKELDLMIQNQVEILEFGGCVIGAFEEDKLVGVCSVDKRLFGESDQFSKMDILYISSDFRGKGVGKSLLNQAIATAKTFGAIQLYISATPTRSTIDFYLNLGAELIEEPDPRLYELEPEDIHLELSV